MIHQLNQISDKIQFNNAGLHPIVVANLEKANYFRPTPIQDFCIPAILSKKDVMAVAQTGSFISSSMSDRLTNLHQALAKRRPTWLRYCLC